MTIIGLVYEANIILPASTKPWTQRLLLAATHLTNTTGITMATYGGSPSPAGGVFNSTLNKVGNLLMLLVMLVVCVWIWPSWRRTNNSSRHFNSRNARWLLLAACAGMPFQMIRLIYNTIYAFDRIASLDPVMGSFSTLLVLMFLMHLAVVITATVGGWLARHVNEAKLEITDDGSNLENLSSAKGC
ncbi:hypothetical protein N0V93_000335 [Gnomoniopsis smithogilvyi]|uniref:DUF7702 domain-containing protein n=1 Tax=Gnomoniopsis smithogilvyi TaxID=1191159 RepID=A0A9W8Z1L3_9PEZI|nr:hypothetical protein N0V93_000335 [Gnomoniopsis smithogilvyi]